MKMLLKTSPALSKEGKTTDKLKLIATPEIIRKIELFKKTPLSQCFLHFGGLPTKNQLIDFSLALAPNKA